MGSGFFFEGGLNFAEDGSFGLFYLRFHSNNQNLFQEVSYSKGNAAIMVTERQYHKKCILGVQQVLKEVSSSKVLQGTASIKSTVRDRHRGTATIKTNDRECRNKIYPGSATNRSTTREYDH